MINRPKYHKEYFTYFILFALVLFFMADTTNALLKKSGSEFYRVSGFIRSGFIAFIPLYFLYIGRMDWKVFKGYSLIITLFSIYLLGFGAYKIFAFQNALIGESLVTFNKYTYIFVIYFFLDYLIRNKKINLTLVFKLYEYIFIIICLSIIFGFLFDIKMFESYENKSYYRFGYKGIIPHQNDASLFFLISTVYGIAKYNQEGKWMILLISVATSFLVGTKAALILPILTIFFYLFYINRKKVSFYVFLFTFFVTVSIYIIDFINTSKFFSYHLQKFESENLINFLLTGRFRQFEKEFFFNIEQWSFVNYLFGGQDGKNYLVEMDLFDIFQFFGLIGSIIFFYLFFKIFKEMKPLYKALFLPSYFLLAFLGGHVLYSAMNAAYLIIMKYYTSIEIEK